MTSFTKRNRRQQLQAGFERRYRWNRSLLMGSTGLGGVLAGLALGAGSAWAQVGPNTLPSGGQVVAGSATINQANPSTLNITQTTNRAVINWNSFDVGSNASVNFYQPNSGSWTLNRVTNSIAPSQILGHITANGNIAVINPNGVIFGAGSRVDVNGLVATTANITDQNFMAGTMKFDQAGSGTAIVANFGDITVKDAGLVAFVAPGVQNAGTINARLGKVSLAAGQKFTLDLYGDNLVSIAADGAVTQAPIGPNGQMVAALVDNSGKIVAEGGQIQITAKQATRLVDNAINMSGVVQAQSAYVDKNGDIVLDAGPAGNVVVSGTLDASGKGTGQTGGNITVTGKEDVRITETAKLDASGSAGGGKIKIGGDLHGAGSTPTAKRTLVATGAQINADALDSGNGGTIVVWSDENTMVGGVLSVQGGIVSGNGGLIETSSKGAFTVAGSTDIRLNAPHGIGGTWLLDPQSIIVDTSGASGGGAGTVAGNDQFGDNGTTNTILSSTINTALGGGNVTLQATNDITVTSNVTGGAAITTGTANSLTMQAGRDITINGVINLTGGGSFTATANDSTAGSSFSGAAGGNNGRKDSTTGDFVLASTGSITANNITINVTNNTSAITFSSGGPLAYNPGSVSIAGTLSATTTTTSNLVINAASTNSNFTAASGAVIRANNNVSINVGGSASLAANLAPNFDNVGGGTLTGTATSVFVINNSAQVQDGIDIAASGGTITLASGTTWNEAISISKAVKLLGTSGTSTINASSTTATAVATINTAGNVEIGGVKLVGGVGQTYGVLVSNVGTLNIHDTNVTSSGGLIAGTAIKVDNATGGVTITNGSISGAADDGINIDPAGPIVISGMTINNMGGDGIEVSGTTATASISITGNTVNDVNGNGIFVHDNTVAGTMLISGNTVGNSNTNTGEGGDIGGIGIFVRDNPGYTISINNNLVATGANAAVITGGAGIRIDSTVGAANSAAIITISGNSLGTGAPGAVMQGGIYVGEQNSLAQIRILGNSIDHANSSGVSGITVQGPLLGGGTGVVTISGNSIANPGSNGIATNDVLSGTISGNTIGAVPNDGIRVQLTNVASNASVTLASNSINNPGSNGIYISNTDANNTLTTTFGVGNTTGTPNTISGLSGTANGITFDGARLVVAGNKLNDTTFLTTGGWTGFFVNLANGALFAPGNPTVIDAGDALFDVNGNGVIDANELAFTTISGSAINSQAALDAAWASGGVFDIAQQVENHIHDYRDDTTLGRISPMGNITVVFGNTDFGGGLLGIQTAINLTPASGFVFVNSGDYGETEPGGPDATTPLTINKALTVVGRQGFTSAATGGRTEGGAGESILDFAALSAAVTGGVLISNNNVTLRGFDIKMDSDQGAGVSITGLNRTNIVVTDNFIHGNSGNGIETAGGASLASGNFDGNSIHNIGDTGILLELSSGAANFTLSNNRIVAGTDPSDNGIQIDAVPGAGTNLTVTQNFIEGAGGNGIIVSNFNKVTITQNTIASTIAATVGGDAIRVVAPQSGSVVSSNVIATGAGNLLSVAGAGIHILNESGNQTVQSNSIGHADSGIWVDNAGSGTNRVSIIGNTIDGVTTAGITVSNSSGNDITVFIGTTTIDHLQSATGYGIDVIDNNAGGLTTLTFGSGDTINNAANGIRFDGADTRVTGQTFGDIVIGSGTNSVAAGVGEFFIDLRNQALYGTGAAFNPLQYDVSGVTFNGVLVSTLNPEFYNPSAAIDSDREVLATFEAKIHHYFDDPTLGFIRLKPNSVTLDPTVGLNGVQLAITVSSKVNVDTLYLLPGTYGDPSDLLNNVTLGTNGALLVDRNIKIIGAQGPRDAVDGPEDGLYTIPGVSAKTGGRNSADPTTESILDFNNASVTGSSQGGILISGSAGTTSLGTVALVSIDGVDIQLGTDDTFGIRIDSSVARSNITLINNFVLGIPGKINGSLIDNNGGAQLLSNLTINDNSIANASLAGVTITNAVGVVVQNNSVQNVGADGIAVTNAHFASSVSGNMVDSTGLNGILLTGRNDTVGNDVTVQANVVSNTGTAAGVSGDGIHVGTSGNRFNNVLVGGTGTLGNTVNSVGVGAGSYGDGIEVNSALANVTVQGNTIANTGTIAGTIGFNDGNGIFVDSTSGSVSVDQNIIASGANVFNNGVYVLTTTGDVVVTTNTIGTASFGTSVGNGVLTSHTTGKVTIGGATSTLGNTINNTGENGVYVFDTGNGVLVQFNTIGNLAANIGTYVTGGNGILVQQTTGGDVTVLRNKVGNLAGFGPQNGSVFDGDGILVEDTANNVQVGAIGSGNSVADADQDGIEVRNTGLTVKVIANLVQTVGIGSTTGDGIVVTNTGTQAGSGNGSVTVNSNTVSNVTGNGTADATDTLTSGDGVRVSSVDGNVTIQSNSVTTTGDDGIQVNNVFGTTSVALNNILTVGTGSGGGGDGIQVNKTGRLSSYGSTIVGGGSVDVSDNTINATSDTGIDADDGLTAGDGIRIAHVDGTVGASGNTIASVVNGNIANDGIQIYDITSQVFAGFNIVGSANASIGIGTNDGDGIVVENTGSYATTLGILNSGDVAISGNSITNVVGSALDRDGASNATVIANAPHQFLTAGDGVRVAFADGGVNAGTPTTFVSVVNSITTVGNDGIQVFYVTGQSVNGPSFGGVNIGNNNISTVGVNTTDGDGIQVSYVGRWGGGTAAVGTTIALNAVNNVIGTGLDRDDGLTAGDGIRGSYLDGSAYVSRNQVGAGGALFALSITAETISNDGVQLWNVSGDVVVTANSIGTGASIGTGTNDGDGIQIDHTGARASVSFAVPGQGNVIVSGNAVSNVVRVAGIGAPTADRDDGLTAGDGIRIGFVGGTVGVGLAASFFEGSGSVTGNTIINVNDDGIQVYDVDRTVNVSNNVINSVGVLSTQGDGIQIDRTGTSGAHDNNGSVTVQSNSVTNVGIGSSGTGVLDTDDTLSSNDGIRVSIVDGSVVIGGSGTLANSVSNTRDDGIEVFDVERTVSVINNRVDSVGAGSLKGDGIIVLNTGQFGGDTVAAGGDVTVSDNSISNVTGNGGVDADSGLSAGDGIHIQNVDGNVLFFKNAILNTGDDGVQVNNVTRGTTGSNNSITSVGNGSGLAGDGIQIDKTGGNASLFGVGNAGNVTLSANVINGVAGNALDIDDAYTGGDGIRVGIVDGDVRILNNTIANLVGGGISNDGIQVINVTGAGTSLTNGITINGNLVGSANASIGIGTSDGDGIVVQNTGTLATTLPELGSGSVTISGNTVKNVVGTGAADRDDGRTSGDGVRTYHVDQNVLIQNNLIDPIGDDGVESFFTTGTVLVLGNTIDSVGNGSAWGDGIQISQNGQHWTGIAAPSGVTVASNTITNVISTGGTDPDDGRHAGDGIRITDIDGNVLVGGFTTVVVGTITNTIFNGNFVGVTRDDGIQIDGVGTSGSGNVSVLVSYNTVETISTGPGQGDGIVVSNVGTTFAGYGGQGDVTVTNNTVRDVIGTGADSDGGLTAGDGVRVFNVHGTARVLSNDIFNINDDGVEVNNILGPVTVASNTINTIGGSSTGDGINISTVTGNVLVVTNTVSNVADIDGIHVENVTGDVQIGDGTLGGRNFVTSVAADGIEAVSITGNVFVDTNSIANAGANGVWVHNVSINASVLNNSISNVGTAGAGDGIKVNSITGDATASSNTIDTAADHGIEMFSISGSAFANANSINNVGTTNDGDGIKISSVSGNASASNNTISNATDNGIEIFSISGGVTANTNTIRTIGTDGDGDGIKISSVSLNVTANGNTVNTAPDHGIEVFSVSGSVGANGNTVQNVGTDGTGDGIKISSVSLDVNANNNQITQAGEHGVEIFSVSGNVSASGNTINTVGVGGVGDGIKISSVSLDVNANNNQINRVGQNGVEIFSVSGNVSASGNTITTVGTSNAGDGIKISSVSLNVNANNNRINQAASNGVEVFSVSGGVTTSNNSISNVGTFAGGDGIVISSISGLVVVSTNSISSAANDGIHLFSLASGFSVTNNAVTTSDIGLFIGNAAVSSVPGVNVITGNSLTNNVTWGLVVDTTNTAGAVVLPGDTFPTLNILLKTNTFTGNGGLPDATLSQGGAILNNNLMFILDARGNNFGGVPFTTPTHFETPNTGGSGNAVSDWVRIDVIVPVLPPEVRIQSLLDNFARGPHALTPGDVLAIGPAFDQNGNLFDPYFVDVFGTPFGLAGNPAGVVLSIGPATDYAMCALSDMWRATSCRIAPPPQ